MKTDIGTLMISFKEARGIFEYKMSQGGKIQCKYEEIQWGLNFMKSSVLRKQGKEAHVCEGGTTRTQKINFCTLGLQYRNLIFWNQG